MATKSHGRIAAWTAAVILVVNVAVQLYWALGGTWEHHKISGGTGPPLLFGVVSLVFAGVLLARVGYWRERLPFVVVRIGAWVIAVAVLLAALGDLAAGRFVSGSVDLIIVLLAFVVARSELPVSSRSGAARSPSGKPGAATPSH